MRLLREALLAGALGAVAVLASCSSSDDEASEPATGECSQAMSYESFAGPFFLDWCTGCHSSSLQEGQRQEAPLDVNFDTLDDIRQRRELILAFAVNTHKMPPAGGPTDAERDLLGQWFSCGAPAETQGFDPPPAPPPNDPPPPTGACAEPRASLPASVLPRCSAATRDCVAACALEKPEDEVDDCQEACQKADTTPADTSLGDAIDCSGCVFNQLVACAENAGCHDEVAGLICCLESCFSSTDPQGCFESKCTGEATAFGYCVYYQDQECVDHSGSWLGACYEQGDGG